MTSFRLVLLPLLVWVSMSAGAASEERALRQQHTAPGNKTRVPARRSVPAIPPATVATTPPVTVPLVSSRPPPVSTLPAQPNRPLPVTGCDPGGCWDTGGNRYNNSAGNTYLNNAGRLCTREGAWIHCF